MSHDQRSIAGRIASMSKHGKGKEERAEERLARQEADALRRMLGRATTHRRVIVDGAQIRAAAKMFSDLLGRPVSVSDNPQDVNRVIVQRCGACRSHIASKISDATIESAEWMAEVGLMVRYDYDTHVCPPVEPSLLGLSNEQMDELLALADREIERAVQRHEAILKAFEAKLEQETKP